MHACVCACVRACVRACVLWQALRTYEEIHVSHPDNIECLEYLIRIYKDQKDLDCVAEFQVGPKSGQASSGQIMGAVERRASARTGRTSTASPSSDSDQIVEYWSNCGQNT